MTEIIRDLFRGDLKMIGRPFDTSSRENIAFNQMESLTEKMEKEIPAEVHLLLDQYKTSMMSLLDAACEEEFLSGYRLGVRMMIAAWPADNAGGQCPPLQENALHQCRGDHRSPANAR